MDQYGLKEAKMWEIEKFRQTKIALQSAAKTFDGLRQKGKKTQLEQALADSDQLIRTLKAFSKDYTGPIRGVLEEVAETLQIKSNICRQNIERGIKQGPRVNGKVTWQVRQCMEKIPGVVVKFDAMKERAIDAVVTESFKNVFKLVGCLQIESNPLISNAVFELKTNAQDIVAALSASSEVQKAMNMRTVGKYFTQLVENIVNRYERLCRIRTPDVISNYQRSVRKLRTFLPRVDEYLQCGDMAGLARAIHSDKPAPVTMR